MWKCRQCPQLFWLEVAAARFVTIQAQFALIAMPKSKTMECTVCGPMSHRVPKRAQKKEVHSESLQLLKLLTDIELWDETGANAYIDLLQPKVGLVKVRIAQLPIWPDYEHF